VHYKEFYLFTYLLTYLLHRWHVTSHLRVNVCPITDLKTISVSSADDLAPVKLQSNWWSR